MSQAQFTEQLVNQNLGYRIVKQDLGYGGAKTVLMEVDGNTGQVTITGLTLSGDMTLTGDITVDDLTVGDDLTVVGDTVSATLNVGTSKLIANTTGVAFYGATPGAQIVMGADLTNSVTVGGTNNTIGNVVAAAGEATAADLATTRDALFQLARSLKIIQDGLRDYGLLS